MYCIEDIDRETSVYIDCDKFYNGDSICMCIFTVQMCDMNGRNDSANSIFKTKHHVLI